MDRENIKNKAAQQSAAMEEFEERLIGVNRVAKVVKGGKKLKISCCVVVGDRSKHVGVGFAKAAELPIASRKASQSARRNIIDLKLRGNTIPHRILGKCGAAKVLLRPASEGTGIIACDPIRAILELGGIKDILTKSLGSNTITNLVKATINGLSNLRTKEEIAKLRKSK